MPPRGKNRPAPPPPPPSLWERIGGLPGASAAGARGIGAILSPGGPIGAVIGGGSEALAQGIEALGGIGKEQSLLERLERIGVETGLGAIPFAKLIRPGQAGFNFLRAGAAAGGGDIARQAIENQTLDPRELDLQRSGLALGIGGGAGALVQKGIDKFLPGSAAAAKVDPDTGFVVEQTAYPGGRVLGPKGSENLADVSPNWEVKGGRIPGGTRHPRPKPVSDAVAKAPVSGKLQPSTKKVNLADEFEKILASEQGKIGDVPSRVPIRSSYGENVPTPREQRTMSQEFRESERLRKILEREDEATAAAEMKEEAEALGLEPQTTFTETASRRGAGGAKETVTKRWREAQGDPEEGAGFGVSIDDVEKILPVGTRGRGMYDRWRMSGSSHDAALASVARGAEPPTIGPAAPKAAPKPSTSVAEELSSRVPIEPPVSPLAQVLQATESPISTPASTATALLNFFKSRPDAMGSANRAAKAAKASGETFPEAGRAALGKGLQQEAKAAGLPIGKAGKTPLPPAVDPEAAINTEQNRLIQEALQQSQGEVPPGSYPLGTPDYIPSTTPTSPPPPEGWADKELGWLKKYIEKWGAEGIVDRLKSEKGLVNPLIPTTIASSIIGGLSGAALNPDDPLTGGAIGAVGGAAAPQLPLFARQMYRPGFGDAFREAFQSGSENVKDTVVSALERIPNWQRANLLASGVGLPINAFVGPWGSTIMGGLEEALKGNPAGITALKSAWNPARFGRGMMENFAEAGELVKKGELGRAEHIASANPFGGDITEAIVSGPATAMSAGDITGKKMLTEAGIPENLAKEIMLTSEPQNAFVHPIANWGRGHVDPQNYAGRLGKAAAGMVFPFRRTPANILEQGMERLPGVGALIHPFKEGGADLPTIAAQQAISVPLSAGAYYAGEQSDPETAKWLRRAISNVSGRYSLPANLAFGVGTAVGQGKSRGQFVNEAVTQGLPLPSADPIVDVANFLGGSSRVPRGMYPAALREIFGAGAAPSSTGVPSGPPAVKGVSFAERRRNR